MTIRLSVLLSVTLAGAACDVRVNDKGVSLDISEGGRAEDEWTRTYKLARGGHLEILSAGGPIYVTEAADDAVQVHIVREARGKTDEAAQRALKEEETITEEVAAERVKVQTIRNNKDNSGPFGGRRISTEFRVTIPSGLNVVLKGENADVTLEGVDGQFTLENTNGGFRGRGVSGSIKATTVNGVIDLNLEQVTGDISATTVNGPVRIGLHNDVNATLEARTVNGFVTIQSDLPFTEAERERTRLSGRLGKGGPAITLNTTNGPISVDGAGSRGRARGRRGGPTVVERQPR